MPVFPLAVKPHLLIADDDRAGADSLALLLQAELGCEIATAYDGGDALAQALARRPVAMVLDLDMPVLSGEAVARRVRAAYAEPPLLAVVSANARALNVLRGDGARPPLFDQAYSKPLAFDRLLTFLMHRAGLQRCH